MHYVTSDLHGYPLADFQKLLSKVGFGKQDELYVLGDVIDRNGDGGIETLRWMMHQPNVFFLLGNHEQFLLSCDFLFDEITEENLANLDDDRFSILLNWMENGAEPTLKSLKKLGQTDPQEIERLLSYLEDAPLYDILKVNGKVYILCHAGLKNFSSEKDLPDYTNDELLWNRPKLTDCYYPNATVIFGHTPTMFYGEEYKGKMLRTPTWIDIDTGAAAGLSPMLLRLEDEEAFYA